MGRIESACAPDKSTSPDTHVRFYGIAVRGAQHSTTCYASYLYHVQVQTRCVEHTIQLSGLPDCLPVSEIGRYKNLRRRDHSLTNTCSW